MIINAAVASGSASAVINGIFASNVSRLLFDVFGK
jgi:hypothetical protein